MINKLLDWAENWLSPPGRPLPPPLRAAVIAALALCVLVVLLNAMVLLYPLVLAAGVIGITVARRRRHRRTENPIGNTRLDRYISDALSDEALAWAVSTWSKRHPPPST